MHTLRRGFTLLEILIATGTFMIVMVVAVGIFTLNVGSSSVTEQMRINAQSARFAFESISREIRLAHGIVYVPSTTSKMVIPPFDIVANTSVPGEQIIRIYQATKVGENTDGQSTYKLSRRLYCLKSMSTFAGSKQLVVMTQTAYDSATAKTAAELYTETTKLFAGVTLGIDGLPWTDTNATCQSNSIAGEPVTPKDLATDQWRIVRSAAYPAPGADLSTLKLQPFIEIDMTVSNPRYNTNKDDPQKIKTTLRTMIVPRNFVSPFDVGQVGVQGATE
jgi:Tfp pilus assembly protein PilW